MLWLFKINDFWIFQKIIIFCRQSFLPLCRSQKCNSGFKYKGGSLIRLYRTFRPSAICQLTWNLSGRSFESFRDICPAIQDRLLVSFELCFTQGCGGIRGNFANHVINHKSFFMDPGNKAKSESSNCRRDTWNREIILPHGEGKLNWILSYNSFLRIQILPLRGCVRKGQTTGTFCVSFSFIS